MARLKTVVENLDDIPDSLREFYAEKADADKNTWFVLELDEDVKHHPHIKSLANALEKQKVVNQELKTKLATLEGQVGKVPEGFDADEWTRLQEVDKQFQELKTKGGTDEVGKKAHEAEIQSFKKTHEQQLNRLTKQMTDGFAEKDEQIKSLKSRIHKMVISDGLVRQLAESGVKKEVLPFVQAKLERSAKVIENDEGEPIMVFDTDMGEIPGDQFIPKWAQSDEAKPFVLPPSGGGAEGGTRRAGGTMSDGTNPWSAAFWDMRRQGEIVKKDMARADRMAKSVGHKKALGALRQDAK